MTWREIILLLMSIKWWLREEMLNLKPLQRKEMKIRMAQFNILTWILLEDMIKRACKAIYKQITLQPLFHLRPFSWAWSYHLRRRRAVFISWRKVISIWASLKLKLINKSRLIRHGIKWMVLSLHRQLSSTNQSSRLFIQVMVKMISRFKTKA